MIDSMSVQAAQSSLLVYTFGSFGIEPPIGANADNVAAPVIVMWTHH